MIILATSALIPFKEEERKQEYLDAIDNYKKIVSLYTHASADIRVIESTGNYIPSFFEEVLNDKNDIVYTKTNNASLRNKGVNEFVSIKKGLSELFYYNRVDPSECIIKITGRYQFTHTRFIDEAIQRIEKEKTHDVVAYHHPDGQIFTGCMAAKASKLLEFSSIIDYDFIERNMVNVELVCARWAESQKTHFVDRLGVKGKCALGNPFRW